MKLRKATYLIRALLVAICFQFTAPVVVAGPIEENSTHHVIASQKHASSPLSLASLFEKTEKEGEEERTKFEAVAIQDLALTFRVRLFSFQSIHFNSVSSHLYQQPLFTLHCVYLI
jgi:5,10-methylenetetrahydrofolate reductase